MTDRKICVYAICKNESKFIQDWLDNVSEADYIVVLDTGSTDGSFEILKNDSRVTKVERKVIEPWRFDTARNEAMKLVPDDAGILVSVDLDELFEQGWANVLRQGWEDDDDRCYYTYAWSHNDLGEPQDVFKYDKIHTKDFHWIYPVHEVLVHNDPEKEIKTFDAEENIYLHHFPDTNKSRNYYYDLLNLSVNENPNDSHTRMLLAREYLIHENYDKALEEYLACLNYEDIYEESKKLVLLETYSRIGDIYFVQNDFYKAMEYYNRGILLDNTHLDLYLCLGELYIATKQYLLAKGIIESGLEASYRHFDWTERNDTWIAKANDMLSVAYYYSGNYDKALENVEIAAFHNPNNIRIIKNMNHILLAKYKDKISGEVTY